MKFHTLAIFSALMLLVNSSIVRNDATRQGQLTNEIEDTLEYGNLEEDYIVDLGYEKHQGVLSDDGLSIFFKNIPFAEPPLGELRFKPPQRLKEPKHTSDEVNKGSETRVCSQEQIGWIWEAGPFVSCFGNMSCNMADHPEWSRPILNSSYPPFPPEQPTVPPKLTISEDCLLLDVVVPKTVWDRKADAEAPIMAWIFGGGFIFGWKEQAGSPRGLFSATPHDGNPNFIYVAMNYRLGALGWLGGSDFQAQDGIPNVGLLDQRFALEWVQDKIHLFGGNKHRVTVMGQSAGASSILHHITSYGGDPTKRPPFSQAILQSPAFMPQGGTKQANDAYAEFLKQTGAKDLQDLRSKPTEDLLRANHYITYYSPYGYFNFGPTVEGPGGYVEDLPGKLLLEGNYHDMPMLLGHTTFDGLLFTPPWLRNNNDLSDYINSLYPNLTPSDHRRLQELYPISGLFEKEKIYKVMDLLDDVAISCNNYYLTEAALKHGEFPIYRYLYGQNPPMHGADVYYTFCPPGDEKFDVNPPWVDRDAEDDGVSRPLARFMQRAYVNFVRDGNPNKWQGMEWEDVTWLKYRTGVLFPRRMMNFGRTVANTSDPELDHDPRFEFDFGAGEWRQKRCEFWQSAPFAGDGEDRRGLAEQKLGYEWEL